MAIWSWTWFCALNSFVLPGRPSFLPAITTLSLSALHGLDLPFAQSRSTANNENFKINTGKSWWWDGGAVDFKLILKKEENNRKSEIHEKVGLDLKT